MRTKEQSISAYNGLSTRRIAEDMGTTTEQVRALIEQGELEAVNISTGGVPRYRVRRESYEAFLQRRTVGEA